MPHPTQTRSFTARSVWISLLVLVGAWAGYGHPALAQVTETVLYSFKSGTDARFPLAPVILGKSGEVYGNTAYGGPTTCPEGCGAVFELSPPRRGQTAWTESLLWNFTGGPDGTRANPGMTAFKNSNSATRGLWGVTDFGGRYNNGTVFKLRDGKLSTLYNFTGGADGGFPTAITADKQGALYGTAGGGAFGNGTVFKIDAIAGTFTTIWSFSGTDGSNPNGPLFIDDSGAVYGTTVSGGITNSTNSACFPSGCGTVFRLTPPPKRGQSAWTLTTLYFFTGEADGAQPAGPFFGGVVADKAGSLYGTTYSGGTFASICGDTFGCGVVFKLTPPASGQGAWTETVIWSFSGYADGDSGSGPLLIDGKGAIYGTTQLGGIIPPEETCSFGIGCGVVFKLTPPAPRETAWTQTTLWSFTGFGDGGMPVAGLVADKKGALYGTTENGGFFDNTPECNAGCGVVFKLSGTGFAPGGNEETGGQ